MANTKLKQPVVGRGDSPTSASVSMDLYDQPGHLIRRANQIAVGMFNELLGPDVTPIQYAILRMIQERPGIDQVSLARLIALDTSTTALTAARLATKGLIVRTVSNSDRRQLELSLTRAGDKLLESLIDGVHRLRVQLLSALEPKEQEVFLHILRKFVHLNNEQSRAPFRVSKSSAKAENVDAEHPAPARTKRALRKPKEIG